MHFGGKYKTWLIYENNIILFLYSLLNRAHVEHKVQLSIHISEQKLLTV